MLVVQLQINHSSFTKRTKFVFVLRPRTKFRDILVNDSWFICNCTSNLPITNTNLKSFLLSDIYCDGLSFLIKLFLMKKEDFLARLLVKIHVFCALLVIFMKKCWHNVNPDVLPSYLHHFKIRWVRLRVLVSNYILFKYWCSRELGYREIRRGHPNFQEN